MWRQHPHLTQTGRQRQYSAESAGSTTTSASTRRQSQHVPGIRAKGVHQQLADPERRESIAYKLGWRIDDVKRLATRVERPDSAGGLELEGESGSEVLLPGKQTVDGMYKFDLGVNSDDYAEADGMNAQPTGRRLWLYLSCIGLHAPSFKTDLFIGITGASSGSARTDTGATAYLWTHTQTCEFLPPGDDFFSIPLPLLSDLLAREPAVEKEDAFTICIHITESYGPGSEAITFQPAGQVSVPVDLVSALGALLDVPTGADVRFVCLQHRSDTHSIQTIITRSRKRVIYANSQILSQRSAYFADLFKGDFAESRDQPGGDERYKTVVVESAEFDTVYWMLRYVLAGHDSVEVWLNLGEDRYLYTNEVRFDEEDDHVRDLLCRQSLDGHTVHWLLTAAHGEPGEWDWTNTEAQADDGDHDMDALSVTSSTSHPHGHGHRLLSPTASSKAKQLAPRASGSSSSRVSSGGKPPSHPARPDVQVEPHAHPCPPPPPACALAVYMLAHQYGLDALEQLAKKHILAHLSHATCIPMFLACQRYTDLHESVLRYIHAEWKDVKNSIEFVRCFQEVARGVWGEEGGTVLASMVARLPY